MAVKLLLTTTIILLLDQLSKILVRTYLPLNTSKGIITHTTNTGTLFGLLQNNNTLFLTFSLLAIITIFYLARKNNTHEQILWGLITGGALGNTIDRILYGAVTDFINIQVWPVFNIADTAITIGIILLLLPEIKKKKQTRR